MLAMVQHYSGKRLPASTVQWLSVTVWRSTAASPLHAYSCAQAGNGLDLLALEVRLTRRAHFAPALQHIHCLLSVNPRTMCLHWDLSLLSHAVRILAEPRNGACVRGGAVAY